MTVINPFSPPRCSATGSEFLPALLQGIRYHQVALSIPVNIVGKDGGVGSSHSTGGSTNIQVKNP
jgi:hypothetical protein